MSQNTILTWALRFAGWLLMFIGFSCLTRFLTSLGKTLAAHELENNSSTIFINLKKNCKISIKRDRHFLIFS